VTLLDSQDRDEENRKFNGTTELVNWKQMSGKYNAELERDTSSEWKVSS